MKKVNNHENINHNDRDVDNDPHYLCNVNEVVVGKSRSFSVNNRKGSKVEIAVFNVEGKYYAISNTCKHVGGPLSEGILKNNIVTCPWHGWKYSIINGKSPHEGGDSVNSYRTKVIDGKLYVNLNPNNVGRRVTESHKAYAKLQNSVNAYLHHIDRGEQHSKRKGAKSRNVLGISTTNLNDDIASRTSTSEQALSFALDYAKNNLGSNTMLIKLRDLSFKHCEGYYSKNAKACIFPCSISEMEKDDQMILVYKNLILWADVIVLATPIRWGNCSSLYYKMIQRMNCVQNQIVTQDRHLIRDKIAAFIVTGGQDNIQHVAGELMAFWSQLGFIFGKFPFVGWSRGWYAEDTEHNLYDMNSSYQMKQDIKRTIRAAVELSKLVSQNMYDEKVLST
ncbi:MAG TPA: Rieske 2Fe-2S domain-containing protein [Nitrososphaeraceae archaeon]|nr:Rieske 2Fe-2S domain-containing protein [Nitrososphaeraceae archaeon]